jgi:hypothetical protein
MPSNVSLPQPFAPVQRRTAGAPQDLPEIEVTAPRPDKAAKGAQAEGAQAEGEKKGMSFWDVLDVINPLQHIPIVNRIYREVTGDQIGTAAKLAGGALFFGVVGLATQAADSLVEDMTGKDTLGNAMEMVGLGGGGEKGGNQAETAAAQPAAPPVGRPHGAPGGTEPAVSADLAAVARQQAVKELQATPGASAAAMSMAGLPPAAALASLSAPGSGSGGDVMSMASLQQQAAPGKEKPTGMALSKYRLGAVSATVEPLAPYVPPVEVQAAMQERGRQTGLPMGARPLATDASRQPTPTQLAAQEAASQALADDRQARKQEDATAQAASARAPANTTPLPPAFIADVMAQGLAKYEAMNRNRPAAASGRSVSGNF